MKADLTICRLVRSEECAGLPALYTEAGWLEPGDTSEGIARLCAGSTALAGAFDSGGALIGFARLISDGAGDGYIQDVIVSAAFRRRGVGGELVKLLIGEAKRRGISWLGLIATPGNEKFYASLGFETLQDHTPMRFNQP